MSSNSQANITKPLGDYREIALQDLWARIVAALGDHSLAASRPKTASGESRRSLGHNGEAFPDNLDAKNRRYASLSITDFRETLYYHFQGVNPDWIMGHLLRANGYDAERALQDLFFHCSWRKLKLKVDDELMRTGEAGFVRTLRNPHATRSQRAEAEGFMHILRSGCAQILRGLDTRNRIVVYVRVRFHRAYTWPGSVYKKLSVYFSEYCRLQMADAIDEVVMLFDLTEAGVFNVDDRPLRNFIEVARDIYPQGLGDVIMHRMPRSFLPFWKLAKRLMRPEFVEHIHFTRSLKDLEEFVPLDTIPAELGGGDDFLWKYSDPDLDDPMNGGGGPDVQARMAAERERLLRERHALGDAYIAATKHWIEVARLGRDASKSDAERSRLTDELVANYWHLDPYIRARSIFDKFGMLPQPEKDVLAQTKS